MHHEGTLYAAPGDYGLIERPKPAPGIGETLIKVSRAALCYTDLIIRNGTAAHIQYPVTPGHEFAGVVEEVGPGVKFFQSGDRVAVHPFVACGYCPACRIGDTPGCESLAGLGSRLDGGFAEYCLAPAQNLFKLPEAISLEEGALLEPLANAVSAVRQAGIQKGDRVVILGPGPIGLMALQVARLAHPAELILVGTRDERLAMGKHLGATHTVNIQKKGAMEQIRRLLESSGAGRRNRQAEVVLECAGTRSAFEAALELVGWRGRLVMKGIFDAHERLEFSPLELFFKSATLKFSCGYVLADFASALELVAGGQVNVKSLVTHHFPLAKWESAFDIITRHKDEGIKVEFTF